MTPVCHYIPWWPWRWTTAIWDGMLFWGRWVVYFERKIEEEETTEAPEWMVEALTDPVVLDRLDKTGGGRL